jgi:hypothetical protein
LPLAENVTVHGELPRFFDHAAPRANAGLGVEHLVPSQFVFGLAAHVSRQKSLSASASKFSAANPAEIAPDQSPKRWSKVGSEIGPGESSKFQAPSSREIPSSKLQIRLQ